MRVYVVNATVEGCEYSETNIIGIFDSEDGAVKCIQEKCQNLLASGISTNFKKVPEIDKIKYLQRVVVSGVLTYDYEEWELDKS